MPSACQFFRWALALGLGLTLQVTHAFRSQGEFLSSLGSYEIAFPTRVDHNGALLAFSPPAPSRRRRRGAGTTAEARLFYKVSSAGTHFLLNLTHSPHLLAGHVSVEYWTREGLAWQRAARPHCLYAGHLQGQAGSSHVAISTCGGLHGLIVADEEEYLIEPLQGGIKGPRSPEESGPHVVYKRSSLRHPHLDTACGVRDEKPWKGRPWWLRSLKPPPARPPGNETERGQPGLKRSVSRERYVETLVVADRMMVAYHGRRDVEQYVLAIMSIVRLPNFSRTRVWGSALTFWSRASSCSRRTSPPWRSPTTPASPWTASVSGRNPSWTAAAMATPSRRTAWPITTPPCSLRDMTSASIRTSPVAR